jgi:hypothetical protein
MHHSIMATSVLALALLAAVAPAGAGPCGQQVAAFRKSLPIEKMRGPVGSAPQSLGAQLEHQPTPQSVARAQQDAESELSKVLKRAAAFDAEGKEGECRDAFARAKLLANP